MADPKSLDSYQFASDRSVAGRFGLTVKTVRQWADAGLVARIKLPGSAGYLVSVPGVESLLMGLLVEAGTTEKDIEKADNPVSRFLGSFAVRTDRDEDRVVYRELHDAYVEWCGVQGIKPLHKQKVGRFLGDMGLKCSKDGGITCRLGLRRIDGDQVAGRVERMDQSRPDDADGEAGVLVPAGR